MLSLRSLLILFALMSFAVAVFPQASDPWASLQSLPQNTRLIVELKTGRTVKGRFDRADDSMLTVGRDGRPSIINRDQIYRVYRGEKGSRWKSGLIGAGIGLAVGVAAAVIYERSTNDGDGLAAAGGVLYGVPIGAAVGGLAGGGTKKGRLLYQSP